MKSLKFFNLTVEERPPYPQFLDPQDSHITLLEDKMHTLYHHAEMWLECKAAIIRSNQIVEQNYIINSLFIAVYKAASEYMEPKLAEEFTIALSAELKPRLIKLLESK